LLKGWRDRKVLSNITLTEPLGEKPYPLHS
jgi:hypothetical protein